MSDYHDYYENLAFPPQEIKSQDDLNEQRRQSDVLIKAIEKCEKLEKEVKRLQFENQHVIWLKHRNEALDKDNKQLKELLKEFKEFFYEENPKDSTVISERMDDLLTRINVAIGESEE